MAGYPQRELPRGQTRLDVHHLTYERLWAEEPDDLIVLCRGCHKAAHGADFAEAYSLGDPENPTFISLGRVIDGIVEDVASRFREASA